MNFLCVSVDSHLLYLFPPKTKTEIFFWGNTMEIKPHSFFVLSLQSHLVYIYIYIYIYINIYIYIYIYIYIFYIYSILHYSSVFWLQIYLKKLCKFFFCWVHFCDGERYILTCLLACLLASLLTNKPKSAQQAKPGVSYKWSWSSGHVSDPRHTECSNLTKERWT